MSDQKWWGRRQRPVPVWMRQQQRDGRWFCSDCGAGFRGTSDAMFEHSVHHSGPLGYHSGFSRTKPVHRGPADLSLAEQYRVWYDD
jgi:hypothetical protein